MKTVGFFQKHLCIRGTTTALYDYARANETVCNNRSIIFYLDWHPNNNSSVIAKFKEKFRVIGCQSFREVEDKLAEHLIDYLYIIKYGNKDEYITDRVPTMIHSVFTYDPHGIYACVSRTTAEKNGGFWLPHIVEKLPFQEHDRDSFRTKHDIPLEAYVYGRYGGFKTFSIDYVKKVIKDEIEVNEDFYFIFANTEKFIDHPRVLLLPEMVQPEEKGRFISSCDAMLHARIEGETFGLSIAEFALANKPILTSPGTDNEHIRIMSGTNYAIVYENEEQFRNLIWTKHPEPKGANPYEQFSPENVMEIFWKLFK